MFPLSLTLVFLFELINTPVLLLDLQQFRHEFRTFHLIMRQILVTRTTNYDPRHGSFVIHTKLCNLNKGVCCGYDS